MSKFSGRLVKLGIGRETSRGAGVASTYHVPHVTFSYDDKVTQARLEGGMGVLADSEAAFVTTKFGAGDLEGEVRGDSFGLFLYSLLGTLSTAGPTDSAYTHSFSVNNVVASQSLSFTVTDSNTTEMYKLVMLDTLEMAAELDNVLKFSASFMGKQAASTSDTVPTLSASNKYTKKHLSFKIAANVGSLTAASAISLKNLTLTFSKGVVLDDVLGTAEPEDILGTLLGIEGQVTLNYEDETYKNYMRDGTNRAMEIKWTDNDTTIGASTNPSLTMRFPKVDFFEWEPNYALDEIVSQTFSFKASRDVANSLAIISTCDLVNDVASY